MPKLGRPFLNLLHDLEESSQDKKSYFFNGLSEVQRKAPFGTNYTPTYSMKIVGSKYKRIEESSPLSPRSFLEFPSTNDGKNKLVNNRPVLPPIYTERDKNYNLLDLVSLLPVGTDLPNRVLTLRNSEQLSLIDIARHEIQALPDFMNNLKSIYLMLTKFDINLTGSCSFREFVDACHNHNVHLTWDLFRIISAMFVVSNRDDVGYVHYEKILSFLGAIFNTIDPEQGSTNRVQSTSRESQREPGEQPLYFHDDNCTDIERENRRYENYIPMDDTNVIRTIIDELGSYPIPIQRIRLACQRADSFHRGTLSAKQLEDICANEGLIFRKNTFDKILHCCKYMGGGQFKWQTFMEFMEKIQPINTGLQIPNSKMPIDYIKHIPSPASSWPHAEPSDQHHDFRETNLNLIPKLPPTTNRQDFSQQHSPTTNPHKESPNQINYRITECNSNRKADVPEFTNHGEPWFNRFLKFVDSVYLRDVNSRGVLPSKELFDLSTLLNYQLGLNLTSTELISALDGSSVDHDNTYSNINSFLKRLSILSKK